MDWDALRREEFGVAERWAYFDHAAVAPLPRRSVEMLGRWAAEQHAHGVVNRGRWEAPLARVRDSCAKLLNAHVDEIAFVNSTTHGIGLIAEGFPWQDGDNVVTAEEEYPSNLYPWLNLEDRGVTLRTVPTRDGRVWPEDLEAAMDARTRVLTISHVEWASGFRNDLHRLGEVCKRRGIALFVDAIQGLGPLTVDVADTPIDFLCADGHKWLLGPEGAGLLYIRREWIDRLRATGVGWHSVTTSYNVPGLNFHLKPSAERWEGGTQNVPGLLALGEGLDIYLGIGLHAASARILEQAERAREVSRRAGWEVVGSSRPGDLSGIVPIRKLGVDPDAFAALCRTRGVALSSRRGCVRLSPHVYNGDDDFARLADVLATP